MTSILKRISLRQQIYLILSGIIIIVITGGLIIIAQSKRIEDIMLNIVDRDLIIYQTTEQMESALVHQKGFVTYFYVDLDPTWLEQLGVHRQVFKERLEEIILLEDDETRKNEILRIKNCYETYIDQINQVISLYKKGLKDEGFQRHLKARSFFFDIMESCEAYKKIQSKKIRQSWDSSRKQSERLIVIVMATAGIVFFLVMLLLLILVTRILDPLRHLAEEAKRSESPQRSHDEIQQLSYNVHDLIENAGLVNEELKQSRAILMQSEKLALVGKLAAGMAHSIRNPLTSVTMRLFSLARTLKLSESQKEDFDVISEEIRHLDIIVQNFLEFSRPPKLIMQVISPSAVVDQSLQLLAHRLKSYNVSVTVNRTDPLADIRCDPEQLKEVFVNLIVNACEAMKTGGQILIEERETASGDQRSAEIQVTDTGPGIPDTIIEQVFQPFFSTKEEGTGLGLSIAARIVSDHGGKLDVLSQPGEGTTFRLTLPIHGD